MAAPELLAGGGPIGLPAVPPLAAEWPAGMPCSGGLPIGDWKRSANDRRPAAAIVRAVCIGQLTQGVNCR